MSPVREPNAPGGVEQILTHLGLPSEPVRADPAQPPPASAADLFAEIARHRSRFEGRLFDDIAHYRYNAAVQAESVRPPS